MALLILRVFFICVAAGVATYFLRIEMNGSSFLPYLIVAGMVLLALGVIAIDIFTPRKRIEVVSAVYFGLIVGALITGMVWIAISPLMENNRFATPTRLMIAAIMCYGCTSLILQTKDDFRFVIPYVEFARDLKGIRPLVLDTSSIIDGAWQSWLRQTLSIARWSCLRLFYLSYKR